ncbi:hypothetical protein Bca101_020405 [Brassica carinata]
MVSFQLPTFLLLYKIFHIKQKPTASQKKTKLLLLNPPDSLPSSSGEASCGGSMVGALVAASTGLLVAARVCKR